MNYKTKLLILGVSVALSGCATIFCGTSHDLNVKAVDASTDMDLPGAKCTVIDSSGHMYPVSGNPGVTTISKGNGSLRVECHKEGYHYLNTGVGDSFNAVTIINVLFWPGLIVDSISGAYKNFPSYYVVRMAKDGAEQESASKAKNVPSPAVEKKTTEGQSFQQNAVVE